MTRPRIFDDGTLAYPERGSPPPDMLGYIRDPGNPFHLLEVRLPCKFRQTGHRDCNCGTGAKVEFVACELSIPIVAQTCNNCLKRVEPDYIPILRAMWLELHTADSLPQDFIARIPCDFCRKHFSNLLADNCRQENEPWFDYSVRLHNLVNASLGKLSIDTAAARLLYNR